MPNLWYLKNDTSEHKFRYVRKMGSNQIYYNYWTLSLFPSPSPAPLSLALALLFSTKGFCARVATEVGICGSDLRCNPVCTISIFFVPCTKTCWEAVHSILQFFGKENL